MTITFKETKIGRIPEEWEVVPINDICRVRRGASPRPIGDPSYFADSGRGWVRIEDVTSTYKYLRRTTQYLSPKGVSRSVSVNPGDLIMSICATIGKPIIVDMEACIHDGFVWFNNISPEINRDFFFYILQFKQGYLSGQRQTGTQGNLNTGIVGKTLIPVPSIKEQNRITEILSTVDETIEKTDAIMQENQQLKKGLMQKLFVNKAFMVMRKAKEEKTDLKPVAIHELGEIVTGTTPSTTVREYYDNPEYMFIGPADIGQSKRIVESANHISKEGFAVSRQLPYNAVMVVGIGATIGKVGITSEPCTTNQQINTIIPNIKEFPTDYVYYLLAGISAYVSAFAGQTATPIMNKGEFGKMMTFIHPTFEERQRIAQILSEVDAQIEKEKAFKSELKQLKKGLMQVLLTGKVRVKV